jgi:NAD(P)-dependent dehydrogenase (short-subunit alcohol dehydrogenase family)
LPTDIVDPEAGRRAVARAWKAWDGLDQVVNAAGVGCRRRSKTWTATVGGR